VGEVWSYPEDKMGEWMKLPVGNTSLDLYPPYRKQQALPGLVGWPLDNDVLKEIPGPGEKCTR
jgi:hypothetical protein